MRILFFSLFLATSASSKKQVNSLVQHPCLGEFAQPQHSQAYQSSKIKGASFANATIARYKHDCAQLQDMRETISTRIEFIGREGVYNKCLQLGYQDGTSKVLRGFAEKCPHPAAKP